MAFALALIFPAAMIVAAVSDLLSMTIPNRLVMVLCVGFLPFALAAGLTPADMALHALLGLGALALTFGCFAAGWMGGGDAKLIAAVALWLGLGPELLSFAVWTSIFGGALTLAFLAARACVKPATGLQSLDRLLRPETGIPYGVAIAAAGLLVFPALVETLPR